MIAIADAQVGPDVLFLNVPSTPSAPPTGVPLKETVEEAGGSYDELAMNTEDIGTTASGRVVSYLQSHPDVKYVMLPWDDWISGKKEFMRGNDRIKKMRERPGTAEAVEKILAEGEELDRLQRMNLAMIREAGRQTQTDLAKQLQITQGAVSRLERRDDMRWSTLRTSLTATGAENPRIVVTVHGVDVTLEI